MNGEPFSPSFDLDAVNSNRVILATIDRNTFKARTFEFKVQSGGFPKKIDAEWTQGQFSGAYVAADGPGSKALTAYRYADGYEHGGRVRLTTWQTN